MERRTPRPKPKVDFTVDLLDFKNTNLLKNYVTDAGRILLAGREVSPADPAAAQSAVLDSYGAEMYVPDRTLCMDNGAMIAYVGWLRHRTGATSAMSLPAVPNLELV